MKTMSAKISSEFSDSTKFTSEMQQQLTANHVTSVSPSAVTADTTAAPKSAGTVGSNIDEGDANAGSPDDNLGAGAIVAIVLATLFLIGAFVSALVWQQKKLTPKHDTPPSIELFEKRGSMNSLNPLDALHISSTTVSEEA